MFNKVLVANRGEIACRVIKTCRRLGIKSVAVYSDADAHAPHVKMADEAHHIGPSPASESYLDQEKLIEAAKSSGAEAVHPGYGFLSERADFSEAVAKAGMAFVGPPPESLKLLGTKTSARLILGNADVPTVPWVEVPNEKPELAKELALNIGLPVPVKASAAGGGKGITVVRNIDGLTSAIESAVRASQHFSSGSDAKIHLEKYIQRAHHVEVQVVADQYGSVIHLMERECSIQRRYQKVVEESPSMTVSPLLRQRLTDAAIRVMKTGRYVNSGTVEFLVDGQNNFYFLEVNSRIQVEHPVTELITGVDMVEMQLRIAAGEKLSLAQPQVRAKGHAIEARIYAEDPETFLPSTGVITKYREPNGAGVRVDSGVCQGYEVTPYYDPLLAKVIVWKDTREEALYTMSAALEDFVLEGVVTNIPLLTKIMTHPTFLSGDYHTTTLTPEFAKAPVHRKGYVDYTKLFRLGR